jgi:hypothetical protein
MFGFRRWVLCAAVLLGLRLGATPALTTISDTLFTADGERFNGVVTISWQTFEAADASNVASETLRVKITNGVLFVQLVPTTNALSPAVYTVMYSSLGGIAFNETWTVPPSILPVRVSDVRLAPGSVTGSAPGAATSVQITDVTGLQNALNIRLTAGTGFAISRAAVINSTGSIDGAVGSLSDCLHVDGSAGACGSGGSGSSGPSGSFVDGEIPSGTLDGVNNTFTLANTPNPPASVALFRNGVLLRQGTDYTLTASSLTFLIGAMPQPGDILVASYRMSVTLPGIGFIDAEVPSGSINGANASFTLFQTPNPAASVAIYRNGLRLMSNVDYTISGSSIAFVTNLVPQAGDVLLCSYRIAQ